jgi:hypothetical protein
MTLQLKAGSLSQFDGTLENGDAANGLPIAMSFTDAMELWGNGREHIAGLVVENVHINLHGPIEYEALGSSFYEVQVPAAIEGAAAADGEGLAEGMMVEGAEGAN